MFVAGMIMTRMVAQIFLWFLIEGYLTAWTAEVVSFFFVLRGCDRGTFIYLHFAYWINCHVNLLKVI